MPTIVDYLGLSPGNQAQGTSLLPAVLEGKSLTDSFAYMETLYPKTALGWAELRAVRTNEWKYVAAPKPELYHLTEDPAEARNVDDDVQGLIALVVIAVGGVCMATGVLSRLTQMINEALGSLF